MSAGFWSNDVRKLSLLTRFGVATDADFDSLLCPLTRRHSETHWTPVNVALKAARLLVDGPDTRVLDIGSGTGKFCIVGALSTLGSFVGIEQRHSLVCEAERLTNLLNVPRVEFFYGNMADVDWRDYDAFYLYNPFFENVATRGVIDQTVEIGLHLFNLYVDSVQRKLESLPPGTRVVTYHGFGGKFPASYQLDHQENVGTGILNLWKKIRPGA